MNIQSRGPGRYFLRWELPHAPGAERQRATEMFHGDFEAAQERWLLRARELRQLAPGAPRASTVRALAELWLAEGRAAQVRPATRTLYETELRLYVLPALGDVRLDRLTPRMVAAAVAGWAAAGVGPRTQQVALDVLRRCLDQAVRWEWLPRNPAARVDRPAYRARDHVIWTQAEARQFLAATRDVLTYGPLYRLALFADARQSEILGLQWADVQWDPPAVYIRGQFGRERVFADPKTGETGQRWCPVDRETAAQLRAHREAQAVRRARLGADWPAGDWVFTTASGRPLQHRNLVRRFHADVAAAGIPGIRFQDLRATGATLLAELGASERLVAARLGHTTTRTARKHYLFLAAEAQRPYVDRVAAALQPAVRGRRRRLVRHVGHAGRAGGDTAGIRGGDIAGYEE